MTVGNAPERISALLNEYLEPFEMDLPVGPLRPVGEETGSGFPTPLPPRPNRRIDAAIRVAAMILPTDRRFALPWAARSAPGAAVYAIGPSSPDRKSHR